MNKKMGEYHQGLIMIIKCKEKKSRIAAPRPRCNV